MAQDTDHASATHDGAPAPWWTTWALAVLVVAAGVLFAVFGGVLGSLAGAVVVVYALHLWARDRLGMHLPAPPYQVLAETGLSRHTLKRVG